MLDGSGFWTVLRTKIEDAIEAEKDHLTSGRFGTLEDAKARVAAIRAYEDVIAMARAMANASVPKKPLVSDADRELYSGT